MKRYLVYYDRTPLNGLSAVDSVAALRKAKTLTPKGERNHIRVRLASKGLSIDSGTDKEEEECPVNQST